MSAIRSFERPTQSILGIGYQLILRGSDTDGRYELMRFLVPPGVGPPPHMHEYEDECFHVVSGRLSIQRGEEKLRAEVGDSVHLPRGFPHAFVNDSDEVTDMLCWVVPANLEDFFGSFIREWPEPDAQPPQPQDSDIQAMIRSAGDHEIEMLMGD